MSESTQGIFLESLVRISEAFLLDRRAQNMSPGTIQFYTVKLKLFLSFCEQKKIECLHFANAAHQDC